MMRPSDHNNREMMPLVPCEKKASEHFNVVCPQLFFPPLLPSHALVVLVLLFKPLRGGKSYLDLVCSTLLGKNVPSALSVIVPIHFRLYFDL